MTDDQGTGDGLLDSLDGPPAEAGSSLRLRVEQHQGARGAVEVLSITGDLDVLAASLLREHLPQCQPQPAPRLVVADLAGVGFMDSSGVGALIALHRRHVETGGAFAVCCVQPQPRQVLSMTAADRFLTVHTTLADALGVAGRPVAAD